MFREYVATLIDHKKQFVIIGNLNALHYKEIFPLIRDNKLWLGASIHSGDRAFYVPNDYPLEAAGCGIDETGRKYIRVKGVRWFTNVEYKERYEDLDLYKKYIPDEYPKYDNYDAINVDKTSDIPVAEEAALTLEFLGNEVIRLYDIGVAGLHRTLSHLPEIMDAEAIVAIAGMEGALASVLGGLAQCPVIAVPTSVGYGASFSGLSALLSMLNSCASGVSVVNIDNGFGAGYQASLINHSGKQR